MIAQVSNTVRSKMAIILEQHLTLNYHSTHVYGMIDWFLDSIEPRKTHIKGGRKTKELPLSFLVSRR